MLKKSPGSFAFECQLLDIEWGVPFPQIQFAFCWNGRFEMKDGGQQPGVPTGRVVSQRAFKQWKRWGDGLRRENIFQCHHCEHAP